MILQNNLNIRVTDWDCIPYPAAWQKQTELFNALIEAKRQGEVCLNTIVMCTHPHVYTLGRSGKESNMLLNEDCLKRLGATLHHIDRGGDITYHGPGQLVCYPILNLETFGLGLKDYIHLLEEAVIQVCLGYDIEADRLKGATGVWLKPIHRVPGKSVLSECVAAILLRCTAWHSTLILICAISITSIPVGL